ncbi:MAG: hypothetical protein MUD14_00865 [Hydrococcus sp. Prado102]|jgi:Fe2+ transport system protein B|nr:hypothetical protein [Hydrococcus sp. Prado102]
MMNEADRLGLELQPKALELELRLRVVLVLAAANRGFEEMKSAIATIASHKQNNFSLSGFIEIMVG